MSTIKDKILHKSKIYPIVLILIILVVRNYREKNAQEETSEFTQIQGTTMGTTYSIKYENELQSNLKNSVDSILADFNNSLSTYIEQSEISKFNRQDSISLSYPYLRYMFNESQRIYENTQGAFNPTVMPLVRAWGFGPGEATYPDSSKVDSIMQYIDFESIQLKGNQLHKIKEGVELDFSAIAKGYGVDVVAQYLTSLGINNYMVEIGGEIVCKGHNPAGKSWTIGVEDPQSNGLSQSAIASLTLNNQAIATSGNYKNFKIKDGVKYAHTINPFTGYPQMQTLLSASVIAPTCAEADAYATAFMVLGFDKSKDLIENLDNVHAYLIYSDEEGNVKSFISDDKLKKQFVTLQ
ncbi:FAD:protein FMN transferase [Aureibacter tunicatorum]|uniref:FAD:protein FMN transferase n=1 Tax=Aureibacter tunicatorum TaxID=866807 RepID=A0AAE3XL99_9BACT|nr:FAD:protein FMN transferase [Aureibacter tunicatorum]MDR6238683.1 thiamine biosynthesis lipoprotein [Aureibacter tunicatorum]BDD05386.1 FAD:protein FMN transferase [Aureibacter tunicatorum]